MSLMRIDRHPSRRQLGVFAIAWLCFVGMLGAWGLARGGSPLVAAGLWAAAAGVPVLGWIWPEFLRVVYLGAVYVAFPVGFLLSHVLLGGIYYLLLTPLGLLMRALGHDPLQRRFDKSAKSYWVPRNTQEDLSRYFRQY